MKKIVLSTIAALTLGTVTASAAAFTLYEDTNGQVFTKPGAGRTEMVITTDMVTNKVEKEESYSTPRTVKLSDEDKAELKQDLLAEVKKATPLFAKADKLKFSATVYAGYKFTDMKADGEDAPVNDPQKYENGSEFQLRRAYFQVKAYLLDDPKSYYRVTMDVTTKADGLDHNQDEYETVIMKYAYLYIDNILPSTGVELGQVHRPWIDYEEHNSWSYRSIQKVYVEDGNSAHLTNSADLGFNFKTKTKYFDSEVGIFQGEGYHDTQVSNGMSFEWRTTAHLLGVNGKDKELEKTYWDASFFGQLNQDHKEIEIAGIHDRYEDLYFYGLHSVYNQPSLQLGGQYIYSEDTSESGDPVSKQSGKGYNAHAVVRLGASYQYELLARYDAWTPRITDIDQSTITAGVAWRQNKNVKWLLNTEIRDNQEVSGSVTKDSTAYLATMQLDF